MNTKKNSHGTADYVSSLLEGVAVYIRSVSYWTTPKMEAASLTGNLVYMHNSA